MLPSSSKSQLLGCQVDAARYKFDIAKDFIYLGTAVNFRTSA